MITPPPPPSPSITTTTTTITTTKWELLWLWLQALKKLTRRCLHQAITVWVKVLVFPPKHPKRGQNVQSTLLSEILVPCILDFRPQEFLFSTQYRTPSTGLLFSLLLDFLLPHETGVGLLLRIKAGWQCVIWYAFWINCLSSDHNMGFFLAFFCQHLRGALIQLFTLYVLFSQFRPRDVLQGICLLSFH